jgi:hypothetical protein
MIVNVGWVWIWKQMSWFILIHYLVETKKKIIKNACTILSKLAATLIRDMGSIGAECFRYIKLFCNAPWRTKQNTPKLSLTLHSEHTHIALTCSVLLYRKYTQIIVIWFVTLHSEYAERTPICSVILRTARKQYIPTNLFGDVTRRINCATNALTSSTLLHSVYEMH